MKRVTAIITAVVLAFVIALGDQIIALSLSGNPLGIASLFSDDEIEIDDKPAIPVIIDKEPEPVKVNLSYDERLEKGDYYYERGFYSYASNEYVKASNLEPDRIEPYFKMAQAHYELMDYTKSTKHAEEVLTRAPTHYEAQFLLMKLALKLNDFTKSDSLIDNLLLSGITDNRLMYYKALIKIALNSYDEAEVILTELNNTLNVDAELADKVDQILSEYEEFAFAQSGEDIYLSELLSRSLNKIGEYEVAIYKLKEILRSRSDLRDSWIMLGFAYLNLQKHLFALSSFERAYELDPQWPATQYFLGISYAELTRYEDAIVYMNYALDNGFEPQIVLTQKLADLYLEVGSYQDSVDSYESVLEFTKSDINSFVRPIWIYLDFLNEPVKALKLAETTVITFPEDPMAYNLLGWAQTGNKNYIEAEKNLKKAIITDPEFSAAYYNLGKLYEDMERTEDAIEVYEKAYQYDQTGSIGNLAAKRYNALLVEQ